MNLAALGLRSARAAAAVRSARTRADVTFVETDEPGVLSAMLDGRALCSRRRPREEAEKIAASIDMRDAGGIVVLGFGLGHHVRAIAEKLGRAGAVFVFEPDAGLLRAVLERVDCTTLFAKHAVVVLCEGGSDRLSGAITEAIRGYEAPLSVGIKVVEHAPSRARLARSGAEFADAFSRAVAAMRTHVVTTMMQTDVTLRNILMNLDEYACAPGIADLRLAAAGFPAIVVAAGPSLARNIDLLAAPGLRDRCVIIAVQTVLRQLLDRGVRPHFVTALDYHEISRRFYEGLSAEAVEGITLVAEAKANPAIVQAFPGALRMPHEASAELMLGARPDGRPRGEIEAGATVAHLAYYLARHLGCDPVILVGQDLGFTDGQYYARGAAIHDVWAAELGPFRTLEMQEWERIVRMRGNLRRAQDDRGRPIYTDDQMSTYLAQFERDFMADVERGRTVIDATEGGVRKAHTTIATLKEALTNLGLLGETAQTRPALVLPQAPRTRDMDRIRHARRRVAEVRRDVRRVARICRETEDLLRKLERARGDIARGNRIVGQIHALRDEVEKLQPAYALVQKLNQTGAFKRFKADRLIWLDDSLSPVERQSRQAERDAMNVRWLGDCADWLDRMLEVTEQVFDGGPRLTRDMAPAEPDQAHDPPASAAGSDHRPGSQGLLPIVVYCSMHRDGLGRSRNPDARFLGEPLLRATLRRLARCTHARGLLVVSDDPVLAARSMGDVREADGHHVVTLDGAKVCVFSAPPGSTSDGRFSCIASRRWAEASWRGGPGGAAATVFDEVFFPGAIEQALSAGAPNAPGALVVGGDWCLVDPALCDEVIARFVETPGSNRITFTQAPPGLCGIAVERELVREAAGRECDAMSNAAAPARNAGWIGALLGYVPGRTRSDPIAGPGCVAVPPEVRDLGERLIPDAPGRLRDLESVTASAAGNGDWLKLDSGALARELTRLRSSQWPSSPREIVIELSEGSQQGTPAFMDASRCLQLLESLGASEAGTLVTFGPAWWSPGTSGARSFGEPLDHPDAARILRVAGEAGLALHVRTSLTCDERTIENLIAAAPDVISVDMAAGSRETYRRVTGRDDYPKVLANLERLIRARADHAWHGLLVPRITRCDAVLEEIETFYDKWIVLAGSAVIDQLPEPRAGDRIAPLGKPRTAGARDARRRMVILRDGRVMIDENDFSRDAGNVFLDGIHAVWHRLAACPQRWTGW